MRKLFLAHVPDVLALLGIAALLYGFALLASWLAWIAAGALLLAAAGVAAAAERRRTRSSS